MSWFNKKEDKKIKQEFSIPRLPDLPKLPELPTIRETEEDDFSTQIHQLPSFPSSSLGKKFSQDNIKEAITGGKRGSEVSEADESADGEMQMMLKPQKKMFAKELFSNKEETEIPREFMEARSFVRKTEPIFIRIDKFQESLNTFETIKKQISEIEKMLVDVKVLKEEEEKELVFWETELQKLKVQIEKIDKDVFSRV